MHVSSLYIYPIKSCKGFSVDKVSLDTKGFRYDRRFMLVDEEGQMLTQRILPQMALIDVAWQDDFFVINKGISVPLQPQGGDKTKVQVWSDVCTAWNISAEANEYFSDFLKQKVRLVYMPDQTKRVVDTRYNTVKATTTFTDGFPILLISQASLNDLNTRLEKPVEMQRFRPNLVVEGFYPYQEDDISGFSIGEKQFSVVKPCARCVMTTINPQTAEKGAEPLKTLSEYRKKNNKIYFGQNVIHHSHEGEINVGHKVEI